MEELVILDEQKRLHPIESIQQVLSLDELRQMQAGVKEIYVDQGVADYIVRLVGATRETVSHSLGKLKQEGAIVRARTPIIVRLDALKDYLEN